jgi:hypothetical protein
MKKSAKRPRAQSHPEAAERNGKPTDSDDPIGVTLAAMQKP